MSELRLMRFPTAVERDPAVEAWFESRAANLGAIARPWGTSACALLEGTGRNMRHVKLRPLIRAAYSRVKSQCCC